MTLLWGKATASLIFLSLDKQDGYIYCVKYVRYVFFLRLFGKLETNHWLKNVWSLMYQFPFCIIFSSVLERLQIKVEQLYVWRN